MAHCLHGRGYRRIGLIGGTANRDTRGSERRVGYGEAIRELALPEGRIVGFGERAAQLVLGAIEARKQGRAFPPAAVVMEFEAIARETT